MYIERERDMCYIYIYAQMCFYIFTRDIIYIYIYMCVYTCVIYIYLSVYVIIY